MVSTPISSLQRLKEPAFETDLCRLDHHDPLLRVCAGHWRGPEALHEDEQGLLSGGAGAAGVDLRAGVHQRQPGRAGSDRDGGIGRKIWPGDGAVLRHRRHPSHDLRGHLHDAVLLRLESTQRAGVSAPALRRKDARAERVLVRGDDGVFIGHQHVRHGAADPGAAFVRRHVPAIRLEQGLDFHASPS